MLCLLFYYVNAVTYSDKTFNGGEEETIELKPGDYTFHVYGAQGGDAYFNGNIDGTGGKGAYVKGDYHITTTTSIKVIVGTQGSSGYPGPNKGGFPDGGSGGEDTGGFWGDTNEASGGGGGSSKILKSSTKLIVAAGGSGGAGTMDGCPGGGYNTVYCYIELSCQKVIFAYLIFIYVLA